MKKALCRIFAGWLVLQQNKLVVEHRIMEAKMAKKSKFSPKITRVRLNPEQAVLSCTCYDVDLRGTGITTNITFVACIAPVNGRVEKQSFCEVLSTDSSS